MPSPPYRNDFEIDLKYPSLLFGFSYSMAQGASKTIKMKKLVISVFEKWDQFGIRNMCKGGPLKTWILEVLKFKNWHFHWVWIILRLKKMVLFLKIGSPQLVRWPKWRKFGKIFTFSLWHHFFLPCNFENFSGGTRTIFVYLSPIYSFLSFLNLPGC